ncbi:related to C6 finger domain protein [Rhynchosporium secalis]|uniref:Related to C6 finger domain protein n=1 Tax=Rhynchosporium secalis TaxID=38038 RepID=A0A1E1LYR8_RHYSE|nr:related to C6 finger domain protein [Rhynchosporium secalis]
MAAVHGRYLGIQPTAKHSTREVSHSSQCTASFSKCLKEDIKEEQRDAIWATAVMLANIAFASLNISSHEDAWPLKMSDPSDLQWLRLKVSDKALWKIADPVRPSSAFWKMSNTFSDILQLSPTRGIDGISPGLTEVCRLDSSSTAEDEVYFAFAHALSRLLGIPRGTATLGQVFSVLNTVTKEFYLCLETKDPVALLLLYLWYARAKRCRWWIDIRARYEIPAIREYLQRQHGDDENIQALIIAGDD